MSLHTRAAVLSIVAVLALMLGVGALSAGSPALETDAGVTVSGQVFYDLNMNGIYDPTGNRGSMTRPWSCAMAPRS